MFLGEGRGKERKVSPFSLLINRSLVSDCPIQLALTILFVNIDESSKHHILSFNAKNIRTEGNFSQMVGSVRQTGHFRKKR